VKKLLVGFAILALTGAASAALLSEVIFTLSNFGGGVDPIPPPWTFRIGIDDTATDGFDEGIDAHEPPIPPQPELRMHTLDVPSSVGALLADYRDGAQQVDVSPFWTPDCCCGDMRDEIWGIGGVDVGDLCAIDGYGLGTSGTTTGTLSWDVSGAGAYNYCVYFVDDDEEICLTPGGTFDFEVSNRSGIGPTLVITACVIPEPGTMLLIGTGLLGVVASLRRR